jgi:hypothetical protein
VTVGDDEDPVLDDEVVEERVAEVELLVGDDELDDVDVEDVEDHECVLLLEVLGVDEEVWDAVDVEAITSRLMQKHFRILD